MEATSTAPIDLLVAGRDCCCPVAEDTPCALRRHVRVCLHILLLRRAKRHVGIHAGKHAPHTVSRSYHFSRSALPCLCIMCLLRAMRAPAERPRDCPHAGVVLLRLHVCCVLRLLPDAGRCGVPSVADVRAAHLPCDQVRVSSRNPAAGRPDTDRQQSRAASSPILQSAMEQRPSWRCRRVLAARCMSARQTDFEKAQPAEAPSSSRRSVQHSSSWQTNQQQPRCIRTGKAPQVVFRCKQVPVWFVRWQGDAEMASVCAAS